MDATSLFGQIPATDDLAIQNLSADDFTDLGVMLPVLGLDESIQLILGLGIALHTTTANIGAGMIVDTTGMEVMGQFTGVDDRLFH
jgi:hypothetical protein